MLEIIRAQTKMYAIKPRHLLLCPAPEAVPKGFGRMKAFESLARFSRKAAARKQARFVQEIGPEQSLKSFD
jgi:hypothetical protein